MNPVADEAHILLGGYVLDALSEEDDRMFADHLSLCWRCQQEHEEFAQLPHLLALVDLADSDVPLA